MKRSLYIVFFVVVLGILSVGIITSAELLSNDVNSHVWVNFLGRWQCQERRYYEIEFHINETFTEYHYGVKKETGMVRIVDNKIVLVYDRESCLRKGLADCSVDITYNIPHDMLMLDIDGSVIKFFRIE
jgi:hypothetical protein